jgi:hypothetical protein
LRRQLRSRALGAAKDDIRVSSWASAGEAIELFSQGGHD